MPQSVRVEKIMIDPGDWTLLRAETPIRDAIGILRILNEDEKLERGHTTPLILDDKYNLLGLIRLTDLLGSVRGLCDQNYDQCELDRALDPVSELVIKFPDSVTPDDGILDALDIMLKHGVSLVPVLRDGHLVGVVQLGDIFDVVAALLFDKEKEGVKDWIIKHLHL